MIDVPVSASLPPSPTELHGFCLCFHPRPLRLCSDVDKVKNYHCRKRWAPACCTWISLLFLHSGVIYVHLKGRLSEPLYELDNKFNVNL